MSVVIETLIFCDGCGDGPYADGDARSQTAKSQRAMYEADEWHYRGGKDYCPTCSQLHKNYGPPAK